MYLAYSSRKALFNIAYHQCQVSGLLEDYCLRLVTSVPKDVAWFSASAYFHRGLRTASHTDHLHSFSVSMDTTSYIMEVHCI